MPDFRDLFEDYEESAPIWFGIIAEDAANFADAVPVIIPSFDPDLQWGPCRWQSRDNATLPQQGDSCVLIFDDQRNPWIITWWPEAGMSPPVSVSPIGPAGGDLSGTYPNPQIGSGVIVNADVNATAAIAESKLSLATDAAAGTGSRRTLGSGATQAMPGNRTLDAVPLAVADLNMNTHKITGLVNPTNPQEAATRGYVDNAARLLAAGGWWYYSSPQTDYSNRYFGHTSAGTYFDNGVALAGTAMFGADGVMYCRSTGTYHISVGLMDNHGAVSGNYAGVRLVYNGVSRYIVLGAHTAATADTDTFAGSHGGTSMILPMNNGDYMRAEIWSSAGYPLYVTQTWFRIPV